MEKSFWKLADACRGGKSLKALCREAGMKYSTAIDQRHRNRQPSAEDARRIADALGVRISTLLPQENIEETRIERICRALAKADEEEIMLIERMLALPDWKQDETITESAGSPACIATKTDSASECNAMRI